VQGKRNASLVGSHAQTCSSRYGHRPRDICASFVRLVRSFAARTHPSKVNVQVPVFGFHTRMVPSAEPVRTSLPFPENAPQVTSPWCPANTCIHVATAGVTDHIHAVQSVEPASTTSPLGCQATHSTSELGPSSVCSRVPACALQICTRRQG
jgi:hypothetical protein